MIQGEQFSGRVASRVGQRGHQPVLGPVGTAVRAGQSDGRGDEADRDPGDDREEGAIVQHPQHGRPTRRANPQEHASTRPVHDTDEVVRVEATVGEHEHVRGQVVDQLQGAGHLTSQRADDSPDQGPRPGLHQSHHRQQRVGGNAGTDLVAAEPGDVVAGLGDPGGPAAVERDRAQTPV